MDSLKDSVRQIEGEVTQIKKLLKKIETNLSPTQLSGHSSKHEDTESPSSSEMKSKIRQQFIEDDIFFFVEVLCWDYKSVVTALEKYDSDFYKVLYTARFCHPTEWECQKAALYLQARKDKILRSLAANMDLLQCI